ncbi:DUF3568 family protein [Desulfocurvus vexinensis]|uniref:DUF3568 family protein n=1 Tax=Desulfocurvus vexinensis TaxID=399548 RepID=UPI00048B7860|nr:DUF3568 family protein [Desulfocurvus vexinensis]
MRTIVSTLLCAALAAILLSGCAVGGKGGNVAQGATYFVCTGTMFSDEPGTVTAVHAAVLDALVALELPVTYEKKDNLVAVVETTTAEGSPIEINVAYRKADLTRVTFTSTDRVDQYKLSGLLEEIRRNLATI